MDDRPSPASRRCLPHRRRTVGAAKPQLPGHVDAQWRSFSMPRTPAGQQLLREFNVDTSRLPAAIRHDGTVQDPIFTDRTFHDGRGIPPGRRCRSRRVCRESSLLGTCDTGRSKKWPVRSVKDRSLWARCIAIWPKWWWLGLSER